MGQPTHTVGYSSEAARSPVVLVLSPHAGSANGASAADLLRDVGIAVGAQLSVSDLDHSLPQGARWREQGFRAAVAAGGDGTVGAVATQVAESGLPLGILPMGTSNDVARSLRIPLDMQAASEVIADGVIGEIDAGLVSPAVTEPYGLALHGLHDVSASSAATPNKTAMATRGAYFLHAMTLGLNVAFAQLATDVAQRERWGPLTYAASALEALSHFQPVPVTLRISGMRRGLRSAETSSMNSRPLSGDTQLVECKVVQVAAVNTPVFGGAMNLRLPAATTDDRLLDMVIIEALEPQYLRRTVEGLLTALERLRERIWPGAAQEAAHGSAPAATESDEAVADLTLPGVHYFQAREVTIETAQEMDVTLDGELRARTPAYVRVAPQRIRVFVAKEQQGTENV